MSNRFKKNKSKKITSQPSSKQLSSASFNFEQNFNTALGCLKNKDFQNAKQQFTRLLKIQPKNPDILGILGFIAAHDKNFPKAEQYLKKAIKIKSQNPSFHNNLGNILKNQGKFEDAVSALKKALKLKPNSFEAHANLGNVLRKMGNDSLLECINIYHRALILKPDAIDILIKYGKVLDNNDDIEAAIAQFDKVIKLEPDNYEVYIEKSIILEHATRYDSALENAEKALARNHEAPGALYCKAKILFRQNDSTNALHLLQKIPSQAVIDISNDTDGSIYQAVDRLKADIFNKLGDYDKAFTLYCNANNKLANLHRERIKNLRSANLFCAADPTPLKPFFNPKKIARWSPYVADSTTKTSPVFMVGFSRSGTTLLDNILDSHPLISTLEEKPTLRPIQTAFCKGNPQKFFEKITSKEIDRYRYQYWAEAEKYFKQPLSPKKLLVDRQPFGAPYLGHIARFFPDTKILVAIRDPRDVVLSSFMQEFECNIATQNLYDLHEAAHYYAKIMDMMLHFRQILDIPFHFVHYEKLVEDLETEAKKTVKFLDLDWDNNLLNFHKTAQNKKVRTVSYHQVTQPIYKTATNRWKKYEKHLESIFPILQPYIELFQKDRDSTRQSS